MVLFFNNHSFSILLEWLHSHLSILWANRFYVLFVWYILSIMWLYWRWQSFLRFLTYAIQIKWATEEKLRNFHCVFTGDCLSFSFDIFHNFKILRQSLIKAGQKFLSFSLVTHFVRTACVIIKLRYDWSSSQVLWAPVPSRPSSTNCTELLSRMDVPRRRRSIPQEQRRLMLRHSQQTRRRLARFARRLGVSAQIMRHLFVCGHMPIAMWQRFLADRVPVPRCWIRSVKERDDGWYPWSCNARDTEYCLICAKLDLDPALLKPLPRPYWQIGDPVPYY